jgi:hypothetical protein
MQQRVSVMFNERIEVVAFPMTAPHAARIHAMQSPDKLKMVAFVASKFTERLLFWRIRMELKLIINVGLLMARMEVLTSAVWLLRPLQALRLPTPSCSTLRPFVMFGRPGCNDCLQ